eukprot:2444359-Rhodomonas_salina.2
MQATLSAVIVGSRERWGCAQHACLLASRGREWPVACQGSLSAADLHRCTDTADMGRGGQGAGMKVSRQEAGEVQLLSLMRCS